jgi:hypothetical protein
MADESMSPLHELMIDDIAIRKITPKTQWGYIRVAKNLNDKTRAIGDALVILTCRSKQSRLDRVGVFEALDDRFALCCSLRANWRYGLYRYLFK